MWYYRNLPAVAGKLEPPGKYDAGYLPRRVHVTGDIDIHELCWDAKDELWVVNTRFGCLCTLDGDHSYLDIATLQRRKTPSILPAGTRAKIGIVWAGSPTYQNDRHRSIALSELLPILRLPDFDFYSLQKGERCRDLLGLPPDCRVQDLDPSLADFGDTALVIGALDLVITVDTAVAHLVGALAKPVWTLLPEVPDWRWGLTDSTTPWYPSMRLFRQDRRGDWAGVIGRVSEALLKDARVMVTGDR